MASGVVSRSMSVDPHLQRRAWVPEAALASPSGLTAPRLPQAMQMIG